MGALPIICAILGGLIALGIGLINDGKEKQIWGGLILGTVGGFIFGLFLYAQAISG